jgi:TetR/AcrR family transcriptional regulator, ethionamide resistance regulator
MFPPPAEPQRRRRRPEDAEREILDAARGLLAERPAGDLTVGAIMAATTLSRKSFYVYFDNRYDLLRRLVEPLAAERDAIIAPLLRPGVDMATGAREALVRLAELYATHGRLLRALAEASSEDHEAKRAWREFLEPVVQAHSAKIADEIERGRIRGIDAETAARALIGMNLQYFFDELVDAPEPDPAAAAETLLVLWERALYYRPRSSA